MNYEKAKDIILEVYEEKPYAGETACHTDDIGYDISFIIPLYNSEAYIHRCVDSVLYQDSSEYTYEIILVDDGSTDSTALIAKEYADNHPNNIKMIKQENAGISSARNKGLMLAKGRYIALIDHDDYIAHDYIRVIMDKVKETGADVVKCARIEEREKERKIIHYPEIDVKSIGESIDAFKGYIWEGVVARQIWEKVCFPEGYWYEDMITKALVYRMAERFVSIDAPLYVHTCNESNASHFVWNSHDYQSLDQLFLLKKLIDHGRQIGIDDTLALTKLIYKEWCGSLYYSRTRKLPYRVKLAACAVRAHYIKEMNIECKVLSKIEYLMVEFVKGNHYIMWTIAAAILHLTERIRSRFGWVSI